MKKVFVACLMLGFFSSQVLAAPPSGNPNAGGGNVGTGNSGGGIGNTGPGNPGNGPNPGAGNAGGGTPGGGAPGGQPPGGGNPNPPAANNQQSPQQQQQQPQKKGHSKTAKFLKGYALSVPFCAAGLTLIAATVKSKNVGKPNSQEGELTREPYIITASCILPIIGGILANAAFNANPQWEANIQTFNVDTCRSDWYKMPGERYCHS